MQALPVSTPVPSRAAAAAAAQAAAAAPVRQCRQQGPSAGIQHHDGQDSGSDSSENSSMQSGCSDEDFAAGSNSDDGSDEDGTAASIHQRQTRRQGAAARHQGPKKVTAVSSTPKRVGRVPAATAMQAGTAAATGAAAAACGNRDSEALASCPTCPLLPFPRFYSTCQSLRMTTCMMGVSGQLFTSLQGAPDGATAPLQLTVFVHSSEWDPDQYLLSRAPAAPAGQQPPAASTAQPDALLDAAATHHRAAPPAPSAGPAATTDGRRNANVASAVGPTRLGPWSVTAVKRGQTVDVMGVPRSELKPHITASPCCAVVLQEQVSSTVHVVHEGQPLAVPCW